MVGVGGTSIDGAVLLTVGWYRPQIGKKLQAENRGIKRSLHEKKKRRMKLRMGNARHWGGKKASKWVA